MDSGLAFTVSFKPTVVVTVLLIVHDVKHHVYC